MDWLLTVFGAGAVLGAMALQRTRSLFSSDALLALGTTVFAGSLRGVAAFQIRSTPIRCHLVWRNGMDRNHLLMTTVMQNLAPDWVRARAMAVFMLVYMERGQPAALSGDMSRADKVHTFL